MNKKNPITLLLLMITLLLSWQAKTQDLGIPYSCPFDTDEQFSQWTIINANNDNRGWGWSAANGGCANYSAHISNQADDWLISPGISILETGVYRISYEYQSSYSTEKMKIFFGTEPTVIGQSNLIKDYPEITNLSMIKDEIMINIIYPGKYYFSFYAYSAPSQLNLYVDNFHIEKTNDIDLKTLNITGETHPMANRTYDYNLNIKNNGGLTCSNYTAQLLDEANTVICQYSIRKPILSGETIAIPLQFTPTTEQIGTMNLKGKVIIEGEQNSEDNQTALLPITIIPYSDNTNITIGTGNTTSNKIPFDFYYNSSMAQTIYLESELGIVGDISKITYIYGATSSITKAIPIKIYICTTDLDNLSGGWIPYSNFTKVYEGSITIPSGNYELSLTLSTPFEYNGGNLCIMTERPMNNQYQSGIYAKTTTAYPAGRVCTRSHDSQVFNPESPQPGTIQSDIPNIKFEIITSNGGSLSGYIYDSETLLPIEGALVHIASSGVNISAKTGITGRYTFQVVKPGTYTMNVSCRGYTTQIIENIIIDENNNVNQNINLVPSPKHEIISTTSFGGSITPLGNITVGENENQKFEIIPNFGFKISDVLVDNVSMGIIESYIFENITSNHTIHAKFSKLDFVEISIGTGGILSTNNIPFPFFYSSGVAQSIYLAEELKISEGLISSITYYYNSKNEVINYPVKVWLCETIKTNMSGGWIPQNEFKLVYEGNISIPSGQSEVTITFDTPFFYTGKNLCIFTERPNIGEALEQIKAYYTLMSPLNRSYFYGDYTNNPFNWTQEGELTSQVPNIKIHIDSAHAGSLSGKITSSENPVENADVNIISMGLTAKTNSNGDYNFNAVPVGTYSITASKTGYESITIENVQITENTNTNKDIVINFQNYIITATADANGSITPSGNISIIYGGTQEFSIIPDAGYHISDVTVDGTSIGTVTTYKFENITTSHSINANFAGTNYLLTLNPDEGEIHESTINVIYGQPIGILPTPTKVGYSFEKWTIDGLDISATTIWQYTENKTAIAQWKISGGNPVNNLTAQHIAGGNKLTWTLPIVSNKNENIEYDINTKIVPNAELKSELKEGKTLVNPNHIPTKYQSNSPKADIPEGMARITLSAGDTWGDGTGYQFLMGTGIWGTVIPTSGSLTNSCNVPSGLYDNFTYKIPLNANGSCITTNIVINNSISINVPAGTYDFCIANPTPGDKIWIAGGMNARKQNYTFEQGVEYKFNVTLVGQNDNVGLELVGETIHADVLRYCTDAIDSGLGTKKADSFQAAITFPANVIAEFLGRKITAIKIGIGYNSPGLSSTSVWIRNTLTGENLYSQAAPMTSGWNTIQLNTPYTIGSGPLAIGYSCSVTGGYPLGSSDNEQDEINGGNIYIDNEWTTIALNEISGNLCIEGILSDGNTVNIYRNEEMIASQIKGSSYIDNYDVTLDVCYTVEVNSAEGDVSPMSNQACLNGMIFETPTNVIATVDSNKKDISLTWTPVANNSLKGYKIWRLLEANQADEAAWTILTTDPITTTSYTDSEWGMLEKGKYRYAIKAIYNEGNSIAAMSSAIVKEDCSFVTDLEVIRISGGNKLTWKVPNVSKETETIKLNSIANYSNNIKLGTNNKNNNKITVNSNHIPTTYPSTSERSDIPQGMARITLSAGDIWGDGSGYQFLMGTKIWGTTIPAEGPLTNNCNVPAGLYDKFTYKIPTNANGSCTTSNIVVNNSISIDIPVGTYDFCIANPTPNDKIWIAKGANARRQNYNFKEGIEYKFTVTATGQGDFAVLEITGQTPPSQMTQMRYCTDDIDDGVGVEQEAAYEVGITFPANIISYFTGRTISAIKVGISENAPGLSSTSVWVRESISGSEITYKFVPLVSGWNTIELDTPYTIGTEEIAVGYSCISEGYPCGVSFNEQDPINGGHLSIDGEWTSLLTNGLEGNFCIEGILSGGYTVNIYRDGVKIASGINGSTYIDNYDVTLDACYTVEFNCYDGTVMPISERACIEGINIITPSGMTAKVDDNKETCTLAWNPEKSKGFKGYRIWRFPEINTSDETSWTLLTTTPITTTSYTDTQWKSLSAGKYKYAVKAIYDEGISGASISNVVEKTVDINIITPSEVTAKVDDEEEICTIVWKSGTSKGFKGYKVWIFPEMNTSDESSWTLLTTTPITTTSYTDTQWESLSVGKYKYAVKAIYDEGISDAGISNVVEKTVGINNVNDLSLNIYPNPVHDIMYIDGEYTSLEIYDLSGKLMMTVRDQKQINVSELIQGVYLIKAYNKDKIGIYKMIK